MNDKRGIVTHKSIFALLTIILVPIISTIIIVRIVEWFVPYIVLTNKTTLFCILILGLIYLALGGLMYKCRKSEQAEQTRLYKVMHVVICMLPAYVVGLFSVGFGLNIVFRAIWSREYNNNPAESMYYYGLIITLVLSAVLYLLCELIVTKSWSEVKRSIKYLPILVATILFSGLVIFLGINASINREVDADKIKYIEFAGWCVEEYAWYGKEYVQYDKADKVKIVDEQLFEAVEEAYSNHIDNYLTTGKNELYYCSAEYGRINYGHVVGINQGGTTFYRLISFEHDINEYIESLYVFNVNEKNGKFILPDYDDVAEIGLSGLSGVSFNEKEIYNLLKEDLNTTLYSEIREVSDEELLCYATIYFEGEIYTRARIPISVKTPKTYKYIMNEIASINNEKLSSYIDEVSMSGTRFIIYSFICVDDDKVIASGENYAFEVSEYDKFCELLQRFKNEQGDMFVYMEIANNSDTCEGTYVVSKSVPKDLVDEMCEIMGVDGQ